MKDKNIVQYTLDEIESLPDDTDWERVNQMTDEQAYANAKSDPDAQPLTDEELNRFKRVIYVKGEEIWEDEQTVGELLADGEKCAVIPVDREILEWFQQVGGNHLVKINAVLRAYVEAQTAG